MSQLFDGYAEDYDRALEEGISISGENKLFFARERVSWLRQCLGRAGFLPTAILDFGCGTGTAAPFLLEFSGSHVIGVDTSEKSLQQAASANDPTRTQFLPVSGYCPDNSIDLAFCNGVFHHIPPEERPRHVRYVFDALRSGGLFAFWENNPWNPGTRLIMSRISFDRDAKLLSASGARRMLIKAGFDVVRTDFLFIFPHLLRCLRPIEYLVASLPLGAQYQILCRKP